MERIWAPWRMSYIREAADAGCFFCTARESDANRQNLVVARSSTTLTMLNRYPYINGHLMVVPLRHTAEIEELTEEELLGLMTGVRQARRALLAVARPAGFNIGINMGRVAGAGVEDHLHIHVVPRWSGDNNFMPVMAETRVINQDLLDVYDQLQAVFGRQSF